MRSSVREPYRMTNSIRFSERAAFYFRRATEAEAVGDEWESATFFILANHFQKMGRELPRRECVRRSAPRSQLQSGDSTNLVRAHVIRWGALWGGELWSSWFPGGRRAGFKRMPSV